MFSLLILETLITHLRFTALDESVDRLSCITAFIFIFSALLITVKTLVLSPTVCFSPLSYPEQLAAYAQQHCDWHDAFYYLSNGPMQHSASGQQTRHHLQYSFTTYLTIAALFFMLPKILWKTSQSVTDMPILYFCNTTKEISTMTPEKREGKVTEMAKLLLNKITAQHAPLSMSSIRPKLVYCIVKILYLFIAFLQFITLAYFIGQKQNVLWGLTLAQNLYNGITWETTGLFPRLGFCDFTIRDTTGKNSARTVQCVIGINEFNEKIFLFLWFWLIFSFFITLLGNFYTFFFFRSNLFVYSILYSIRRHDRSAEKAKLAHFAKKFLTTDGQLVLSFIKTQSDVVAQEVTLKMWEMFSITYDKVMQEKMALIASGKDLEMGQK